MDFAGQYGPWALIAGASEGTGRAFARKVAKQGLNCILIARRQGPLEELAAEIRAAHGVDVVTAAVDLSVPDATNHIIAAVGTREVGLFINNAGADSIGARFLDADIADWVGLAERNVMNTMRSCHHFGGQMRTRKRGGIILVGSGACYGGINGIAVYCGSKAFDLCFGEGLWTELRPHNVHVLNLILGKTDTPAYREILARHGQPLPTDWASPDDVAEVGIAKLPHGPVHNWGVAEDAAGYAPNSAAARRARILAIESAMKGDAGKK